MLSLLLPLVLASPAVCPDSSQLRWNDFPVTVAGDDGRVQVQGRLYDRDGDGKPSTGDLFHVDRAQTPAGKIKIDQPWMLIDGDLAAHFADNYSQIQRSLTTSCDTRFEIEDVPAVDSVNALGRFVHGDVVSEPARGSAKRAKTAKAPPPPSRVERLNTRMQRWADGICDGKQNVTDEQLTEELVERTREKWPNIFKRSTMYREARAVAKQYSLKCVKFTLGKVTF